MKALYIIPLLILFAACSDEENLAWNIDGGKMVLIGDIAAIKENSSDSARVMDLSYSKSAGLSFRISVNGNNIKEAAQVKSVITIFNTDKHTFTGNAQNYIINLGKEDEGSTDIQSLMWFEQKLDFVVDTGESTFLFSFTPVDFIKAYYKL